MDGCDGQGPSLSLRQRFALSVEIISKRWTWMWRMTKQTMEMTKTFSMTPWIANTHSYLTLMSAFGTFRTSHLR